MINGTHPTLRGDPFSPGSVLRALGNLGWEITVQEHDSPELLTAILTGAEEEATKPKKPIGGLCDVLGLTNELSVDVSEAAPAPSVNQNNHQHQNNHIHQQVPRPSSAMMTDFCNSDYSENVVRQTRSEAHTPDSPHSTCTDPDDTAAANSLLDDTLENSNLMMMRPIGRVRTTSTNGDSDSTKNFQMNLFSRKSSSLSLERLSRGPNKVSVFSSGAPCQVPHPFRGATSSQIVCGSCNTKSVIQYEIFANVILPLPPSDRLDRPALSLGHLLSEYIAPEPVYDVRCETCDERRTHTKTVTFARLPACLCFQISRNLGALYRQDFVPFPESLSMAPYSFVQPGLNSRMGTPWGSTLSLLSNSCFPLGTAPDSLESCGASGSFGAMMFPRNLYRLLAVVVHTGVQNTGHYVTYRRGALRNAHKWFYTSDTVVREVTIEEVLSRPAYLLFYDRGPSKTGAHQ